MPNEFPTSADVLNLTLNVDKAVGVVANCLLQAPLVSRLYARSKPGTLYYIPRITALPTTGFREDNTGLPNSRATVEQVLVEAKFIDCTSRVDCKVANGDPDGQDEAIQFDIDVHLASGFQTVERQLIYGTNNDSLGFTGLAQAVDIAGHSMCVDAGGTTPLGASSCYLINTNLSHIALVWGNGGKIDVQNRGVSTLDDGTGKLYEAFVTPIYAHVALQQATVWDVARIANLTTQLDETMTESHGLTDDLIAEAFCLFPPESKPNLCVMNTRSWGQLQKSRTATSATGAPAPFPVDWEGIPIVVTNALKTNESILDITGGG